MLELERLGVRVVSGRLGRGKDDDEGDDGSEEGGGKKIPQAAGGNNNMMGGNMGGVSCADAAHYLDVVLLVWLTQI